MKLTEGIAQGLELAPDQDDKIWFDDQITGLGLRVRRVKKWDGAYSNKPPARTWLFQYRIKGKTRRLIIGQATAIKAGRAREIASEHHARVKLGHDPAQEKHNRIEASANTFGTLVDKYLAHQRSQLRHGSYRIVAHYLGKLAAPLRPLSVDTIDRRIIAERLNSISTNSGTVTANRARASMSAMFTWGMREGLVLANPVVNTTKREEKSRERILTDAELRLVWKSLDDSQYGTIVKLLLLTGQRLNEIAALRWSELDFGRGVIALPGDRTKNGRPHEVPMSETTRTLLASVQRKNGRELLFGEGRGPFSAMSWRKRGLDKDIATKNGGQVLAEWVHHDLRRSVATGMAEIGIQPHIIEAVLNHVSGHKGGVAGIYNRASYSAEKAQALALWDKHIAGLVG